MFLIRSQGFKINFQNRKWNYPNRKWNYFSTFQASDQKIFPLIFLAAQASTFHNLKDSLTDLPIAIFTYFSYLQASDEKTSFTKHFSLDPNVSKLIFKTGNGIIQTGNGIISPTSRPLMKKLFLQNVSHLFQGFQN